MNQNDVNRLIEFHGHLGPYVLMGLRMGMRAMADLALQKHFGVEVTVNCADRPPQSCIIDGLQIATGATYGKRNIRLIPAGEVSVTVLNTKTGECIQMRPAHRAKEAIRTMPAGRGLAEAVAAQMLDWSDEDLFTVEVTRGGAGES